MTRKSTLIEWGHHLGVVSDAQQGQDMTAAQLEQGISEALVKRDRVVGDSAGDESATTTTAAGEPQYSLRQGLAANLAVLRDELPSTIAAVAQNLFTRADDGVYLLSETVEVLD